MGLHRRPGRLAQIVYTALLIAVTGSNCGAVLIAYEPFDYPADTPLGQHAGGIGWTGPWEPLPPPPRLELAATSSPHVIAEGSLAGPAGLPTQGNHAFISAMDSSNIDYVRRPFPNVAGTNGTSLWISFLGQRVGEATDAPNSLWPNNPYPRSANLSFFDNQARIPPNRRAERISIGNSTGAAYDEWSLIPFGEPELRKGPALHAPKHSELAWVVVRIDFVGDHTAPDSAWMWVNPNPLNGVPSKALADVTVLSTEVIARDYSGLDYVRPFAGGSFGSGAGYVPPAAQRIDELRIGTGWRDVNGGVPEPSTGLLMIAITFVILRRR
jgi:hypothetical protein